MGKRELVLRAESGGRSWEGGVTAFLFWVSDLAGEEGRLRNSQRDLFYFCESRV